MATCLSVCLGGWLAVCHSRYGIKTTKPILKLFRVGGTCSDKHVTDAYPVELVCTVVSGVHSNGSLDARPYIRGHGHASTTTAHSVSPKHRIAVNANDAVHVLCLEVRFDDDSDVNIVAAAIGRQVLGRSWFRQRISVEHVERRQRRRSADDLPTVPEPQPTPPVYAVIVALVWQPGAHEWHGGRVTHGSVTGRNQQDFQCTCTLVRWLNDDN